MPKKTNITNYICDRCGKSAYLVSDDPAVSDWRDVERVTSDGVTTSRLLCKDCHAEYRKLTATQDAAFNSFMVKEA